MAAALDDPEVHADAYTEAFRAFFVDRHTPDIERMLHAADDVAHHSLALSWIALADDDATLGDVIVQSPASLMPLLEDALRLAQAQVREQLPAGGARERTSVKGNCHVRFSMLPPFARVGIGALRSEHFGGLVQIEGTVVRAGNVKMLEREREYQCCNRKCGFRFVLKALPEQGFTFDEPKACPSGADNCKSTRFALLDNSTVCCDYQELKVQEDVNELAVGSIPRSMVVLLEDDLADRVKAGDRGNFVGVLMHRWKRPVRQIRCELETVLRCNSIDVKSGDASTGAVVSDELRQEFEAFYAARGGRSLAARNAIVAGVCPQMYGVFAVKLALLLTLVGGVGESNARGLRIRGDTHMLLIGDPGTGKSQFLRYAAQIVPRSVLTTGIGTTSAGLTCAAVKDDGEWMLEAGALVLADRGLCCIDEFSAISQNDRSTIHEAMEQQTLSVAKAGLVCKLNSRTTVFAVTNPKGRYDTDSDISANTNIASPLLSRFDIVLVMLDSADQDWDAAVSGFILGEACGSGGGGAPAAAAPASGEPAPAPAPADNDWTLKKMRAFVAFVKERFTPRLTREAERVLAAYYQLQRRSDQRNSARTTIRLLESLVRIAQAHARVMMRDGVVVQDAVVAITVVELSMHTSAMLGVTHVVSTDFPLDPDNEYAEQEALVLGELGLAGLGGGPPAVGGGAGAGAGFRASQQRQPSQSCWPLSASPEEGQPAAAAAPAGAVWESQPSAWEASQASRASSQAQAQPSPARSAWDGSQPPQPQPSPARSAWDGSQPPPSPAPSEPPAWQPPQPSPARSAWDGSQPPHPQPSPARSAWDGSQPPPPPSPAPSEPPAWQPPQPSPARSAWDGSQPPQPQPSPARSAWAGSQPSSQASAWNEPSQLPPASAGSPAPPTQAREPEKPAWVESQLPVPSPVPSQLSAWQAQPSQAALPSQSLPPSQARLSQAPPQAQAQAPPAPPQAQAAPQAQPELPPEPSQPPAWRPTQPQDPPTQRRSLAVPRRSPPRPAPAPSLPPGVVAPKRAREPEPEPETGKENAGNRRSMFSQPRRDFEPDLLGSLDDYSQPPPVPPPPAAGEDAVWSQLSMSQAPPPAATPQEADDGWGDADWHQPGSKRTCL